ncbi:hypothetical protein C7H19_24865 [Aphanothece hegewaldii CCALA 016]|uniref:VCBS repeat-containing protein n=1 Tax=Aphanothece hegewaldii CCALA 016 TaxID=2107694 RepID=A0A2T1LQF0_9CHRO|nr:VCBS repeat-containing protein [Aphanothece hegewaldii]PSF27793.1 hypothetical protein C7H19_24865 [Aphanothece hegewaldii CCALA 016]
MDIVSIASLILGIVSLIYAVYQTARANQFEKNLRVFQLSENERFLKDIKKLISPFFQETQDKLNKFGTEGYYGIDLQDLDGDGQPELLIQYPYGAHGAVLKIFGRAESDFTQLGEFFSDTLFGFEVDDFNKDGFLEIKSIETHEGFVYATALRDEVIYRWNGQKILEIFRRKLFNEKDVIKVQEFEAKQKY